MHNIIKFTYFTYTEENMIHSYFLPLLYMNKIKLFIVFVVIVFILIIFMKIKYDREFFTPNFIQIYPRDGNAPLKVTFTLTYTDMKIPFYVDFGDNSNYIGKTKYEFEHIYKNIGEYYGTIKFINKNSNYSETQFFKINVY